MNTLMDEVHLEKYSDLHYTTSKNNGNAIPVYGPFEKLFLSDWGQSKIHKNIVQALDKKKIKQMKPIQKNAFLYLMNNYNVAMVGFSQGKSVSYLTSIFSLILNNTYDKPITEVIGPIAIILTSSLGSCCVLDKLSKELSYFVETGNNFGVVVADATTSALSVEAALCNGCKILIATPIHLDELLKKSKLISWSNLRHFVFDNIDLLLENYKDQIVNFFQILKIIKDTTCNIQFISTSVKWTRNVDEFLKVLFVKWQYIFGSHLEAAHYMKIGFNVVPVKNDKLEKILHCLKNIKYGRSVLITSNAEGLCRIFSYFQQHDSDLEILLAEPLKSAKNFTIQKWNNLLARKQCLLICSDDTMLDYYIDNADCLIHYDIPAEKLKFSTRFSVFQDSNTIFKKKERSSYIFLSDSDMKMLPKVVEVMKDFGNGKLDPILLKNVQEINNSLEKSKINSLFCNEVQQFGYCSNQSCQYRHVIIKNSDLPADNIPKSGLAIIKILNIYNATHMSVKLLQLNCTNNLNETQNWSNVKDYSVNINKELNEFYSNPNNKIIYEKPKPGVIVVVELGIEFRETVDTKYFRATVIRLADLNPMNSLIEVKLIDEGFIQKISVWKIFRLPDKYENIPTNTVDMYVSSVKPIDFDTVWCSKADTKVRKKFAEYCSDTIIVKVKLALATTIWVNKVYRKYWSSKSRIYDFEEILPGLLFNYGYANINVEHISKLKELCTSAGICLPLTLKKTNRENDKLSKEEFMSLYKLPQPQWAHLNQNTDDLVSVDYIISPKSFFVRNSKFKDRLNDLNIKIDSYIEQKQFEELKHIIEGAICLAKHPKDNRYSRGQVQKIFDEATKVEVFFVDVIDFCISTSKSLLTIHPNLITQLPFQAIECSLKGVKDVPRDHTFDDHMFFLTEDLLYSQVTDFNPAEYTGGNHFKVVLYNETINVNLELQEKFNQYFDCNEISNQLNCQVVNENNTIKYDDCMDSKKYIDQKSLDDDFIRKLEVEMSPEDMEAQLELINFLGFPTFVQNCISTKESSESKIEDVKKLSKNGVIKETTAEIISVMPVIEKNLVNSTVEPIEKTIPVCSELPKIMLEKKKTKVKSYVKRRNLCLTCNNYVQSIVPLCFWYQDYNKIYLKFDILEIDNFRINCTAESIKLEAQFKDSSYSFFAKLFGCIIDQNVSHKISYEGLHITVEKLFKTDYKWPRLFNCNKWHKYVKYHPDHIEPKNLDMWMTKMNLFKQRALNEPLKKDHVTASDSSDCIDSFDDNLIVEDV